MKVAPINTFDSLELAAFVESAKAARTHVSVAVVVAVLSDGREVAVTWEPEFGDRQGIGAMKAAANPLLIRAAFDAIAEVEKVEVRIIEAPISPAQQAKDVEDLRAALTLALRQYKELEVVAKALVAENERLEFRLGAEHARELDRLENLGTPAEADRG